MCIFYYLDCADTVEHCVLYLVYHLVLQHLPFVLYVFFHINPCPPDFFSNSCTAPLSGLFCFAFPFTKYYHTLSNTLFTHFQISSNHTNSPSSHHASLVLQTRACKFSVVAGISNQQLVQFSRIWKCVQ